LIKQHKNRKSNQTKEDSTDQKTHDSKKTELKSLERESYPFIEELPIDVRERIINFFSKAFDEQIDLIINLSGIYIDEKQRTKMKKEAETELLKPMEESIIQPLNLERNTNKRKILIIYL
jgi:NAD dependent epimerase/dehydratase family enzyme